MRYEAHEGTDATGRSYGQVGRATPRSFTFATIVAAVANLAVRAARGEPAFPGLDELTARFYEAVSSGRDSPISAEHMSAIALVRDRILTAGPRA